ncbi:MAG: sigma-E processing peptidase SpoIIGA [Sporomusaceae bacterium]|nr:sigma-E processing peptidase SpoIIGA [Sporomusaceae bacterium]
MIVYVDLFLALNVLLNSLLLLITAKLHGEKLRWFSLITAALAGGLYALAVFSLQLEYLASPPLKFLMSLLMLRIAFRGQPVCRLLRLTGCYYLVCFAFGGAVIVLAYCRQPVFTALAPLVRASWTDLLAGASLASGILLAVKSGLYAKLLRHSIHYQLEIMYGNKSVLLDAIVDTGNSLYSLNGKPVVIADFVAVKSLFSPETAAFLLRYPPAEWLENLDQCKDQKWLSRVEIVPFSALGGDSLLLAFRPDALSIRSVDSVVEISEVIIGVYAGNLSASHHFTALLHPAILHSTVDKEVTATCVSPG